jgi:hypothetical protein
VPIIATVVLVCYVTLDLMLDEDMWDSNMDVTEWLQGHTFTGENFIFNFFTYFVFVPPAIAFVIFLV